jgi:CheY-like chemotaxis protein
MTTFILVAGNSEKNLTLVKSLLADEEIEVVRAPTLALALFLTQKNLPCAIVCSLDLPDARGLTLLQELKADKEVDSIPVIFLLAPSERLKVEADLLAQGAHAVLDNSQSLSLATLLKGFIRQANEHVYQTVHSFQEESSE